MQNSCLRLIFACLAAAIPLWVHSQGGEKKDTGILIAAESPTPAPVQHSAKPMGMAGCAAEACHGGTPPVQTYMKNGLAAFNRKPGEDLNFRSKSSFTAWHQHDPHANAYAVLSNDLSKKIVKNLPRIAKGAKDGTSVTECLACHSNPTLASKTDADSAMLRKEGVGCEACHGNAEKWLLPHTAWSPTESRTGKYGPVGMNEMYHDRVRAEVCMGCHVGAPATGDAPLRDVNHDLIAAGHPRLDFEYTAYLRRLPAHWTEKDRTKAGQPAREPGFEFEAWAQGVRAEDGIRDNLLNERVRLAAEGMAAWPEFAEYNCFDCHQGIGGAPRGLNETLKWKGHPFLPKFNRNAQAINGTTNPRNLQAQLQLARDASKTLDPPSPEQFASSLLKVLAKDEPLNWVSASHYRRLLIAWMNAERDKNTRSGGKHDLFAGFNFELMELGETLRLKRTDGIQNSPGERDMAKAKKLLLELFTTVAPPNR